MIVMNMQPVDILIFALGITAYSTAVWQMWRGVYRPSFFSRGVWFLLGINSFAGVYLGEGSSGAVALAATLLIGNAAVFAASYKKGSREFGAVEKLSLVLLAISAVTWIVFDSPYVGLIISLVAHFIGGIPTLWRVFKRPESEQAYHWYFFFVGCILSIVFADDRALTVILFPVYFALFDGLVILLANRKRYDHLLDDIEHALHR